MKIKIMDFIRKIFKITRQEEIIEDTNEEVEYPLDVKGISFSFPKEKIVDDLSLKLNWGESFAIVGQSGSGKTTFLKLCFGLINPDDGEVIINGINPLRISEKQMFKLTKDVGFVFQKGALIQNINVYDNIALLQRYHMIKPEDELKEEIEKKLRYFGIYRKRNDRPSTLSFAEIMSVAFAKIMINEPKIIFMDEPLSFLDPRTERKVISFLGKHKRNKGTILLATKNLNFATSFCDRIGILQDGKFIFIGTPAELRRTESEEIKQTLESLSLELNVPGQPELN